MATTTLQSVRRAMTLLEAIAFGSPVTAKDLARRCGLEIGTTYHLLNTLIESEYLEKEGLQIYPSARLATLGQAVEQRLRPSPALMAAMDRLCEELGETTYLSEWIRDDVVAIASREGTKSVRVGMVHRTDRGMAHARASGKALLAFGPPERLETYLRRGPLTQCTAYTITDPAELRADIEVVQRQGYAADRCEFLEEVCCLSAPVLSDAGTARFAISVLVPSSRFDALHDVVLAALTQTIKEASGTRSDNDRPVRLDRCDGDSEPSARSDRARTAASTT
jgi:IclR family acetate operon transcriptional repressor